MARASIVFVRAIRQRLAIGLSRSAVGAAVVLLAVPAFAQQNVEQWKRFETAIPNSSWTGNPYDIVLTASFTHAGSGEQMTQFGFYAGNDTWKIYFMPDRVGDWSFTTSSSDSDLNGLSGGFVATNPTISGRIIPGNRLWRLSNGEAIFPVILAVGPYVRANPIAQTQGLVDWARDVAGATYLGTTLLNFSGDTPYTDSQEDRMYLDSAEGEEFYLPAWDRSNQFYDAVRDANMGHYILMYSDDASSPNTNGLPMNGNSSISFAEERLFRYMIARLAPYPKVLWDSGIDVQETRTRAWIDNWIAWFQANDPWKHPISSRFGSGAGTHHPDASDYWSDGFRALPSRIDLVATIGGRTKATAFTDRFRENYSSPFNGGRDKVREAGWEMALTYGTGVYFGGSDAGGYLVSNYASDLEAAPDLGVLRRFLDEDLVDLASLAPNDDIVSAGTAWVATDNTREYVVYSKSGSSFTLSFDAGSKVFNASWHDPISGDRSSGPSITGQGPFQFEKPGNNARGMDDWVLHLVQDGVQTRPARITDLGAD